MTKEKFKVFLAIRASGVINMFDIKGVMKISKMKFLPKGGLTKKDCLDIMKNFTKYEQIFLKNNVKLKVSRSKKV